MRSALVCSFALSFALVSCSGCCAALGPRRQIGPPPPDAGIDAWSRPVDASARSDAPSDAAFADGADADLRPMDASPMDARPEDASPEAASPEAASPEAANSVDTDLRDTNELDAG